MNLTKQAAKATANGFFQRDVYLGLSQKNKSLPCKYLYDERGSALFDQICQTSEYYPTRSELEIMRTNSASIAYQIGKRVTLVEYGSGSSVKTRMLLDSLEQPIAYVPVDISEEHLLNTTEKLRAAYPAVEILPVVADFTQPFELPVAKQVSSHTAFYFPGSTIGNFESTASDKLLKSISNLLGPKGGLLIGIDLQKDVDVIEAAYNDSHGVTAEFNLNFLARINNELDGTFDLEQFEHRAIYNPNYHRVEISVVSRCEQSVSVDGRVFRFRRGEEILTEYSHKYTVEGFSKFAARHGFSLHQYWTDARDYFAVLHLALD